ncbi:MAG: hypothetical protein IPK72_08580, partial [Candidatus Eisenbacteria bacterium]|nr:hypothetical protein [Candidatus Eisenbacteria bacterium]
PRPGGREPSRSADPPRRAGRIFDRNGGGPGRQRSDLSRDPRPGRSGAQAAKGRLSAGGRESGRGARPRAERARPRSRAAQAPLNRPIPIARNPSFEQVAQLEERMDRLPGVQVETESSRRYPGGVFAGHLLGYLGEVGEDDLAKERPDPYHPGDLIGQAGIEKFYEAELRGRDGEAFVEVDAFRRRTHYFPELPSVPASPGHDLYLTIHARLQRAAEKGPGRDSRPWTQAPHGARGGRRCPDPRGR